VKRPGLPPLLSPQLLQQLLPLAVHLQRRQVEGPFGFPGAANSRREQMGARLEVRPRLIAPLIHIFFFFLFAYYWCLR
jgi:hypothetical protein